MNTEAINYIMLALMIIIPIAIYILLLVVISEMASKRGRNETNWILAAIFVITPFLAMAALACLGETSEKWEERIKEEEKIRQRTIQILNDKAKSNS